MKKTYILLVSIAFLLIFSLNTYCIPKLNSYPSASAAIFLDFDGDIVLSGAWNQGNQILCAPSGLNDTQITEVFNRVAEDYRPFDINITTDSAVYASSPYEKRIRIIVTTTNDWYQGVGGVAYVGSFLWGDDTPGFVFSAALGYSSKMIGEACSHESGHTLGLSHQSRYDNECNLTEVYNSGIGTGITSWAPIMGNSYYRNVSRWQDGPTQFGCGEVQDNLSILTTTNGFTYRKDDYADIISAATTNINPISFSINGVITTGNDKDAFKFTLFEKSALHLKAEPFSVGVNNNGANLDIKLMLYDAAGALIDSYDPNNRMDANIDTTLNTGTYFIKIDGTGNSNTSDYGSLGSYTISGFTAKVLPIRSVILNGVMENNKHFFSWDIISDEPIGSLTIESSIDGSNFNQLRVIENSATSFSYSPDQSTPIYYRLKVTTKRMQTLYSNILKLKNCIKLNKLFVSSVSESSIIVNTSTDFEYILVDMNGRILNRGKQKYGNNIIDIATLPKGYYIIQVLTANSKMIQKVLKF